MGPRRAAAIVLFLLRRRRFSSTQFYRSSHVDAVATAAAYGVPSTGLYGLSVLKTAKGFRRFVDDAIEKSNELVKCIPELPSSMDIINSMDEISNTVCEVIDSAELCRNTHPDKEYAEEADKASMRIYEYLQLLNTNPNLYRAILKAEKEGSLTEEAKRTAHALRIDFEKGGIHLPEEKLERVNQLNIEIAHLGRQFNENIMTVPGYVDVYPASRIPKDMHHHLKIIYRSKASVLAGPREKGARILTDPSTLSSMLNRVSDEEIRKKVYISGNSVPLANLKVLDKLIESRHELAKIMGCRSYAEFAIRPNMASSVDAVMSFMLKLSATVREKAEEEFESIQKFKRHICNNSGVDLEPWDESYFTSMMKSSVYGLSSLRIAAYFSLAQCLEGLKILVQSLFGATFSNIPMMPGESWHPDVIKLSLKHQDEGDLGFLYLDLYSRKDKYPGCAHFAIRGGRRLSPTEYQLPIVALVCNFPHSNGLRTQLNYTDVETLFHEFGHALHSLLSRTDYQHFSGTRVALDVAETPSNLFEYYAYDYRVLKTFARDAATGEVIPEKLVKSLNSARSMFAATELQRQIFYSLIDLTLFGEQPTPWRDTISIVADLKRQHTSWRYVKGTHWHTRFSHLVSYGAGYYSYLYARCFAAVIWQKLCQEDPLSQTTGSLLRANFLRHGGAKDPSSLLKNLVGDGILIDSGGGIIPDNRCLLREIGI